VILDREYNIAYRLEPMQNAVDAVRHSVKRDLI